ncbi:hypothetical protein [Knoellia koreensis]|uniref:Thioesterase family protein n=1 Tax=Knoellia koreensis TaxID=2730921 RepID=A0A849HJR9_9MICO|nr:hypothetical protein [Knoellia sp. DB2414S]NNM46784.1 hypothetical protein [Knoellia sp. DB2414S]
MAATGELIVPARYCGPPHSGNGGWVSGTAAAFVPTDDERPAVTVRLRTPPPLDRPLAVTTGEDGTVRVTDGDHPVLEASAVARPAVDGIPAAVSFAVAEAAGDGYEGLSDHPFPTCFTCGTQRGDDALDLRPGRLQDGDTYAAAWTPAADVDVATVWAALDCPGGWSAGFAGRPMVLGTMTAWVGRVPTPGEPHVVMAWPRGAQGRKFFSGTALYAAGGDLLGQAEATWIAVDPAAIRPAGS